MPSSRSRLRKRSRRSTVAMRSNIEWWLTHMIPMTTNDRRYAAYDGHWSMSASQRPPGPAWGMLISRTSSVIAIAMTPSLNASRRWVVELGSRRATSAAPCRGDRDRSVVVAGVDDLDAHPRPEPSRGGAHRTLSHRAEVADLELGGRQRSLEREDCLLRARGDRATLHGVGPVEQLLMPRHLDDAGGDDTAPEHRRDGRGRCDDLTLRHRAFPAHERHRRVLGPRRRDERGERDCSR